MDGREETSIWKKEITFRRKPKVKGEAALPPSEKTSIWKKEITLRRNPPPDDHVVPAVAPPVSPRSAPPSPPVAPPVAPPAQPLPPVSHQIALPPVTPRAGAETAPPDADLRIPPVSPDSSPVPESREATPVVEPLSDQQVSDQPIAEIALPPVTPRAEAETAPPEADLRMPPVSPGSSPVRESREATPLVEPLLDQPVSDQPVAEIAAPPVTPPAATPGPSAASTWVPPVTPPGVSTSEGPPAPEPEPEREPLTTGAVPEVAQPSASEPAANQPELSPRQDRKAQRAADRDAKERRKRAEKAARKARKANPAMHSRVVGLKVGGSQIAAAEVINKSGPRIARMARMPLDRGVVVGGEVRDPDALAAALKTFFRKNKLPKSHVRLGVANNRIGVRVFEIDGIEDEKQLANAIRFRAQETLPIPLDEAVLDYRVLDERLTDEGVRVRRVLLVVAHRDLVERYVAACRKAGLKLIGIDLEAFAVLRALSDPATPRVEDAGLVCITIGHDRSTLAVSDGRVCEFTRVLSWGGSALDAAVARVLDLTPSAAEPIRRELSLDEEGEAAGIDARHAYEARRAIAAELQVFAREITASLRFYQEQPESLGISEILITGGAAASGGLPAELERLIGVPVRVADPLGRVKLPRKLRTARGVAAGSLAVAVGLGIED
jgi:type IV pilus assembly protein PilM